MAVNGTIIEGLEYEIGKREREIETLRQAIAMLAAVEAAPPRRTKAGPRALPAPKQPGRPEKPRAPKPARPEKADGAKAAGGSKEQQTIAALREGGPVSIEALDKIWGSPTARNAGMWNVREKLKAEGQTVIFSRSESCYRIEEAA